MLISEALTKQCCSIRGRCVAGDCMAWKNEPKYEHKEVPVESFDTKVGKQWKLEMQRIPVAPDSGYCALVEGERHE